jgi:hypothetical protein
MLRDLLILVRKREGTQEAQKAQEGPLPLVPFVLLVFLPRFLRRTATAEG